MSYSSIAASAVDPQLAARIQACALQEARTRSDPFADRLAVDPAAAALLVWPVVTAGDVEAAYAAALDNNVPDPGADPAVVTDGMILANVQAGWPASS